MPSVQVCQVKQRNEGLHLKKERKTENICEENDLKITIVKKINRKAKLTTSPCTLPEVWCRSPFEGQTGQVHSSIHQQEEDGYNTSYSVQFTCKQHHLVAEIKNIN